jgi:GntR family transcriptional regulator/MocR family aminotransferase
LRRDFAEELNPVQSFAGAHLSATTSALSVDEVRAVVERAASRGVAVQDLAAFAVGERQLAGLVFGYGAIRLENIEEGLERLRASFDDVRDARVV